MKATVLVIDDDETIRHFLPRELKAEGYQVLTADSGKAGLQLLEKEPADHVLLDIRLPDLSDIPVVERIRAQWTSQIAVIRTPGPEPPTAGQPRTPGPRGDAPT